MSKRSSTGTVGERFTNVLVVPTVLSKVTVFVRSRSHREETLRNGSLVSGQTTRPQEGGRTIQRNVLVKQKKTLDRN